MKTIVIALGGNALQRAGEPATCENQIRNIEATVGYIVDIVLRGNRVVITHGNGPQVGRLLLQGEAAREQTPPMPMDVCGAMTQGMIGYHIQQCLHNDLRQRGLDTKVCTVVTQVCVDKDDPALQNPTKPVGKFYTKEEAEEFIGQGQVFKEDAGRGYRRVVPSPRPCSIVEIDLIRALWDTGAIVVCGGGGGIPVFEESEMYRGIEAVIDKDFASCVLARQLGADMLMILTEVENVCIGYGTPHQQALGAVRVEEMEQYRLQGEFAPGSMLPKVEAAIEFYRSGPGRRAVITSLDNALKALDGEKGTILY